MNQIKNLVHKIPSIYTRQKQNIHIQNQQTP